MTDVEVVERLQKCAQMLREERPEQVKAASPHRDQCVEPSHYGCNIYQSIQVMETAADRFQQWLTGGIGG